MSRRGLYGDSAAARKVVDALDAPAAKPGASLTMVLTFEPRGFAPDPQLAALRERIEALDGQRVPGLCWHGQRICGACRPEGTP